MVSRLIMLFAVILHDPPSWREGLDEEEVAAHEVEGSLNAPARPSLLLNS